ncbi:MAG: DNA anti-recombination protein RmuC, partial [Candidatus Omnitrophota bacterium]
KRLAGSLGDVIGQVEASMSRVVEDVRSTDEAMVSSRQKIAQEETNRVNELLSDFQDRAGEVAAAYQSSAESLESVTREGMDKSVGAATQLAVKLDEIRELSSHIDKMLHLQESVERSLDGLAVSEEFRKTLSDLRGHLATTDEFCAQMSKPRVITLTEELLGDDR